MNLLTLVSSSREVWWNWQGLIRLKVSGLQSLRIDPQVLWDVGRSELTHKPFGTQANRTRDRYEVKCADNEPYIQVFRNSRVCLYNVGPLAASAYNAKVHGRRYWKGGQQHRICQYGELWNEWWKCMQDAMWREDYNHTSQDTLMQGAMKKFQSMSWRQIWSTSSKRICVNWACGHSFMLPIPFWLHFHLPWTHGSKGIRNVVIKVHQRRMHWCNEPGSHRSKWIKDSIGRKEEGSSAQDTIICWAYERSIHLCDEECCTPSIWCTFVWDQKLWTNPGPNSPLDSKKLMHHVHSHCTQVSILKWRVADRVYYYITSDRQLSDPSQQKFFDTAS